MQRKKFLPQTKDISLKNAFEQFINSKIALNRAEDTISYYSAVVGKHCG